MSHGRSYRTNAIVIILFNVQLIVYIHALVSGRSIFERITHRGGSRRCFLAQMSLVNLFGDVMDNLLSFITTLPHFLSLICELFGTC